MFPRAAISEAVLEKRQDAGIFDHHNGRNWKGEQFIFEGTFAQSYITQPVRSCCSK